MYTANCETKPRLDNLSTTRAGHSKLICSFHVILLVRIGSSQPGSLAAVGLIVLYRKYTRLKRIIARGFRRQVVFSMVPHATKRSRQYDNGA